MKFDLLSYRDKGFSHIQVRSLVQFMCLILEKDKPSNKEKDALIKTLDAIMEYSEVIELSILVAPDRYNLTPEQLVFMDEYEQSELSVIETYYLRCNFFQIVSDMLLEHEVLSQDERSSIKTDCLNLIVSTPSLHEFIYKQIEKVWNNSLYFRELHARFRTIYE